jgi:hypothetical protein
VLKFARRSKVGTNRANDPHDLYLIENNLTVTRLWTDEISQRSSRIFERGPKNGNLNIQMDSEFLQTVRDNLISLGYENLSDSLVEEFARRLQDDEGVALSLAPDTGCEAERPPRTVTLPIQEFSRDVLLNDFANELFTDPVLTSSVNFVIVMAAIEK